MTGFGVHSEIGKLRKVITCQPGLAHSRLTPANADALLYDDVLWVQEAKTDHADFRMKMSNRGVEVYEFHDLLSEIVAMPEAREWILDRRITEDQVGVGMLEDLRAWLSELAPYQLAVFLVGGIAVHDLPFKAKDMFGSYLGPDGFVIPPLPNTQFPRDNSCWIGNGLTLNPMFWPARRPETLLVAAVYKFHPAFSGGDFKVWWGDPDTDHGPATLEGGDVMPWGNGTVLIGRWRAPFLTTKRQRRSLLAKCREPAAPCISIRFSLTATAMSPPLLSRSAIRFNAIRYALATSLIVSVSSKKRGTCLRLRPRL